MDADQLRMKMAERWRDEHSQEFSLQEINIPYPIIHLYTDENWYYEAAIRDASRGLVAMRRRPVTHERTAIQTVSHLLEFIENPRPAFIGGAHLSLSRALMLRVIKVGFPLEIQYFDERSSITPIIRSANIFSDRNSYDHLIRFAGEDERAARRRNRNELHQSFRNEFERIVVRRLTTNLSPKGELFFIKLFYNAREDSFFKFLKLSGMIWNLRRRGVLGTDSAFDGNPNISAATRFMYEDICEKLKIPFPEIPHS